LEEEGRLTCSIQEPDVVISSGPSFESFQLDPRAPSFCPSAVYSSRATQAPFYSTTQPHPPVSNPADTDDTQVKVPSILSAQPDRSSSDVPAHLQELFDTTMEENNLSMSLRQSLADVLRRNADAFATSSQDLGFCSALLHDIDTGEARPIKQPPRRPPLAARDAEDKILLEMLHSGVIEPSHSPWASPVCLVKKKDNSYRFCIDYRRVNDVTKKDAFPVPSIQDALDSLKGARYFATIDLLCGYWQVGMTPRAKERSAFCTRRGLFQFVRMPFGLCGAPSTFCRLMHLVLDDLLYKICLFYLDDVIIFAATPEELIERLDVVFTRLRDYGLKIKPAKCVLFKTPIEFLGHLVSADGLQPQPEKLATIRDWPMPRCLKDVRAFVGLVSYYRRFVRDFASIAEPLTRLTKKHAQFIWTDETQEAFDRLKSALLNADTLSYPDPALPVIVDTDASDVHIGAVLSQVIGGLERPIAFFSRVLNPSQRKYCTTRRELLAVVAAFQYFRHYLLGASIILRTDHHSLKWLTSFKRPEGILARWVETLAEYNFTIQHRAGRLHSNADAISRQTCKQCLGRVAPTIWIDECERADDIVEPLAVHRLQLLPELTDDDIAQLQAEDTELGDAYRVLHDGLDPTPDEIRAMPLESRFLLSQRPEIALLDGVIVRQRNDMTKLVVPTTLRRRLFELTHAGPLAAHLGARKTALQLQRHYYWRGMTGDVRRWCRQCQPCATSKGAPLRPHGQLEKIIAGAPLDLVTVDLLSGLPTAVDGSKHLLVAVDVFTKWTEAFALPDQEASTCVTALYNGFFARMGLPRQLHSDQGRQFESSLVQELCKLAGVHKTRTTPFHARGDGQTERANRTILQMLRSSIHSHPEDWPSRLPSLLSAYRMSPHATTGLTPNFAMLGRECLLPCTFIAQPPEDYQPTSRFVSDFRDTLRTAHRTVREALHTTARAEKTYFDRRVKPKNFVVGQLVYLYWPRPLIRQKHRKLSRLWTGPWRLIRFLSPIVVVVQNVNTNRKQTVHVDRLAPCSVEAHSVDTPVQAVTSDVPATHQSDISNPTSFDSHPPSNNTSVNRRPARIIRRPQRYCW